MADPKQRCQKVKYRSRAAAARALRRLPLGLGGPIRVYRCGKHNSATWHLTHTTSK